MTCPGPTDATSAKKTHEGPKPHGKTFRQSFTPRWGRKALVSTFYPFSPQFYFIVSIRMWRTLDTVRSGAGFAVIISLGCCLSVQSSRVPKMSDIRYTHTHTERKNALVHKLSLSFSSALREKNTPLTLYSPPSSSTINETASLHNEA